MPLQVAEEKPKVFRFHSQNLNDKPGGRQGWKLRQGRAWFHFWKNSLNWEWHFLQKSCGIGVLLEEASDYELTFHLQVPLLFSFFVSLHCPWFGRSDSWSWLLSLGPHHTKYEGRVISFDIHNWTFWWQVWTPQHSFYSKGEPWWMRWNFNVPDFFLGRWKHSKRELRKVDTKVPMPEKTYDATVTVTERTWKRPRWPFRTRRISSTIEIPGGIPHPGKGTCGYNCGEDALISCGVDGDSIPDAVGHAVSTVMNYRERYPL